MNKIIAIFDSQLRATAFIGLDQKLKLELTSYLSSKDKEKLESVILESIDENLAIVESNLLHLGYVARIIPGSVKQVLKYVSYKLNQAQREKFVPQLINLPEDLGEDTMAQFLEILFEMDELANQSP